MPLRRLTLRVLVALTTSLSMLHLTLEGSGVVCSSTRSEGAQRAMSMADAASHAGHGAPAASATHQHSDAAQHGNGGHLPTQERCCESMSNCGVTPMASVAARTSAPWPPSGLPAYSDSMLASVATAPEPPPPKA